jgi:hypothetical protein
MSRIAYASAIASALKTGTRSMTRFLAIWYL